MTDWPTLGLVGENVKSTASDVAEIVIVWLAVAVFEFPSVTVTETVNVFALLYVVVKLDPVPLAGDPPVAVQANVYGVDPPVAEAVNVTAVPVAPVVGPLTETASASAETVVVADPVAVLAFASVAVTETV